MALGLVACLTVPSVARAAGRLYQVREVKPHVFVWIPDDVLETEGDPQYPRAGTSGFIITPQGVIVVDTTNSPFHARELLYEIRQRTDQPIRYVVDTGGSGDEVLGNEVFSDLQATLVSTSAIQTEIRDRAQALAERAGEDHKFERRLRGIHITAPGQTFDNELQLSLGGQEIRLIALDSGLRAASVYLPAAKVAFLGDLFQNQYFPRLESRDLSRWIEALRQAEAWDAEVYVPGHGEPAGKKEVEQFRAFLEWLTSEVRTRVAEGKSLAEVKAELLPLKNYPWHAPEQAVELVEDAYQQLASAPAENK
jgi:glyoxylase-like metal-dependent hydrolase (beta-lactamase superfamily II)